MQYLFLVIFSLAALTTAEAATRDVFDRPNVIIFYLDDSGYGDFAHNGNPTIDTPHITKLANEGVNFTQYDEHLFMQHLIAAIHWAGKRK